MAQSAVIPQMGADTSATLAEFAIIVSKSAIAFWRKASQNLRAPAACRETAAGGAPRAASAMSMPTARF
jgi:hypothetical protein